MAARKARKSRRSSSSRVKRRGSLGRRRSKKGRTHSRSRMRFARSTKSSRSSVQRIQTLFPDIAVSRLRIAGLVLTKNCVDWNTSLAFAPGTPSTNGVIIALNSNPNGGIVVYRDAVTDTAVYNPVLTYTSKYKRYRCHGMKLVVDVIYADNAAGDDAANSVARPFTLVGFPFQSSDSNMANYWNGSSTNAFNVSTIPTMKYGFRRVSAGMGGKVKVTYKVYWPIAKIFGITETQFMADDDFCSFPQAGSANPTNTAYLAMHISDYNQTQTRVVSMNFKLKQYGRWEGQQADYT